jgi:hypothetical protein
VLESARYAALRMRLRTIALPAIDFGITIAARKGPLFFTYFTDMCGALAPARSEVPRARTSFTSLVRNRALFGSMRASKLSREAFSSFGASAFKSSATCGSLFSLQKSMAARALALFGLVRLRHVSMIAYPHLFHNLFTQNAFLTPAKSERILTCTYELYDDHERTLG